MIDIFFVLLILFAILALQTSTLRRSIIYLSVFSLLSSMVYLLHHALDVALAEAVIGCTLSTILFLVALKKYKVFRVYFIGSSRNSTTPLKASFLLHIRDFIVHEDLSLELIHTRHSYVQALNMDDYDLLVEEKDGILYIYGYGINYHLNNLHVYLKDHMKQYDRVQFEDLGREEA